MQVIQYRRALHRIPELDRDLPETLAYLRGILSPLSCTLSSPIPGALCAFFDFGRPDAIAFRSDADALPITERTGLPFASVHPGRMHACGHDGHMAMVLDLAVWLDQQTALPHNVLLLFQPAEETTGGAKDLCQSGVLEAHKVQCVFGMHLWPELPAGVIASRKREMMSRSCEVSVTITGRSSHIAKAEEGLDALAAGVEFYRRAAALEAALPPHLFRLLKFGRMESGTVRNAVSGKTVLLWELADRARKLGFVVATPTVASEDMLERIVEKIQEAGEPYANKHRLPKLAGGSLSVFGFSAGLEFTRDVQETKSFQFKLTQLARKLTEQGHGILILIDELQANSPEIRQLVTAYQELVGEGLDVALVMAGLPGAVSATLNDRVLTFLNRARKVTLEPLSVGDVDAYYQRAFEELDLDIPGNLRLDAARATQGSPYMLQLIGYNIANRCQAGEHVTPEQVDGAIEASKADFENDVCETTLAALSDQDVAFLAAMADDEDAVSRISDVAKRMSVTPDYAQKYRRRLIDAGVIEQARRGYVRFAVPYMADYLRSQL